MQAILGVFFHFLGGFASGSFYVPYKRVKDWAWESYWITGGFFSWLLVPFLAAYLTIPHFLDIIFSASQATVFWTYLFGLLWGIGGATFGLALRYLGMSLGMAVALGFTSAFGALMPPIYRDIFTDATTNTFSSMLASPGGLLVLSGVLVCLLGIFICGKAGMMKENQLTDEQKKESIKEFNLLKGLVVAMVSGILSACFNYGIETGKPMAVEAMNYGSNSLFQNNVTFVVILLGGLTTNLIWCFFLNIRNKTFGDYTNANTPLVKNYLFSALAGTIWFLQFFFYGMGESRLGNGASSWILHMAFIILVSNVWGIYLKEWKAVNNKAIRTISIGIMVVVLSTILVGIGNYMLP